MENNSNARIAPHSIEAEESVLGSILLDNDSMNLALERIDPEHFYKSSHKYIYEAMKKLCDASQPIDIITLSHELKSKDLLDQCGGMDYVSHLSSLVPSSGNIAYYAKVVKDMALRRKLIHESSSIINDAFNTGEEIGEFLDSVEQKILKISDDRIGSTFSKVGDIVQSSISNIEKMYDQKDPITGVNTGFEKVNQLTAGLQGSDLIILAARPAMGKTSLALTMAQNVGIQEKLPVAVFSLEMSKEQLVLRMLCSEARVDNSKVRTGHLAERDFPRLVDAASKIAEAPIYIDDTPALTVTAMRAKARRLSRDTKLSMIIVDYLQLMRSPFYAKSREQEIADISRSLKALAKELNIPVVALAQLNRSVESRVDKRPMMSDLRESGAIEQDADLISFIYRDEVYNPETVDKGVAELILAKHRSGPTGTVRLAFSPEHTRFDNLEEHFSDTTESNETIIDFGTSDATDDLF